jgi:hypothetical protein
MRFTRVIFSTCEFFQEPLAIAKLALSLFMSKKGFKKWHKCNHTINHCYFNNNNIKRTFFTSPQMKITLFKSVLLPLALYVFDHNSSRQYKIYKERKKCLNVLTLNTLIAL